jgi:hypothetical protein
MFSSSSKGGQHLVPSSFAVHSPNNAIVIQESILSEKIPELKRDPEDLRLTMAVVKQPATADSELEIGIGPLINVTPSTGRYET